MFQDSPTTEDVRERLDCRQIAEKYGVRFRNRSSEWWLAHCFNSEAHAHGDRNPSLSIGPQGYKCFSANCAISGDVFGMIAYFENLEPREQFEKVFAIAAEIAGIETARNSAPTRSEHESSGYSQNYSGGGSYRSGSKKPWKKKKHRSATGHVRVRPSWQTPGLSGPPPLAELFPGMHDEPFHLDPRHVRLEIMQAIWELVRPLDLTGEACKWLESRGIRPEIAHAYGCRDWRPVAKDLLEVFASYSEQDLIESGLQRQDPDKDRLKRWCGLRDLDGEDWARGLAVPIVHPGWPIAPLAWRWRLYNPFKMRSGQTFKALAQYSGEPSLPSLPLGLAPPSADALLRVAKWPSICEDSDAPRYAVVLSEGEPDWLSVADVAANLATDLYVVSVGLVAMSHGYPTSHVGLLEDAERVVCVMDKGRTVKKWGKTGGEMVIEKIRAMLLYSAKESGEVFDRAYEKIDNKIVEFLQPDDQDVNDLHQQGKLVNVLDKALGDIL
jgi:hypothetical protein